MTFSKLLSCLSCAGFAVLLAGTGCNPYNPDLGEEPFLCGTDEPRCPDGYKCDERSEAVNICVSDGTDTSVRPDAMPASVDAMPFVCNDDSQIDNNNTIGTATQTPIPALGDEYSLVGLSICPTTDVDIYSFRIDQSGKNMVTEIEFDSSRGDLLVDILNSSGLTIRSGEVADGNPNLRRASINNMAMDTYYVRVEATPGVENNYAISIVTSGP